MPARWGLLAGLLCGTFGVACGEVVLPDGGGLSRADAGPPLDGGETPYDGGTGDAEVADSDVPAPDAEPARDAASDAGQDSGLHEDAGEVFDAEPRDLVGLNVQLLGAGVGQITSTPPGLTCPGSCSASFDRGSQVGLVAAAAPGHAFVGWTGACVGGGACTVTLNAEQAVAARFEPVQVAVQVLREGDAASDGAIQASVGPISCPGQCVANYAAGTQVTLTAVPTVNTVVFSGWRSGPCSGQSGACTFTVSQGLAPISASFLRNRLSVATLGQGSGRVTSMPAGIDCGANCQVVLPVGTSVTLTASPSSSDFRFGSWSGDCVGTAGTCSFALNRPSTVDATFELRPPPVTNHQLADLVLGQANFTASTANAGGRTAATMNGPRYCHTDGTRLWIADSANARVLQWDVPPSANGAPADVVLGQESTTTSAPGLASNRLQNTTGKVVASSGRLYIADPPNTRVMVWEPAVGQATGSAATNVLGQLNFTSSERSVGQNAWDRPYSFTVGLSRLILVDTFNHRVLIYNQIPSAGRPSADLVLGQVDALGVPTFNQSAAPNPPTANSLNQPQDAHYDPTTDRLFVVDTLNHRVLGWQGIPTAARPPDLVLGQTDFISNAVHAGLGAVNPVGMNTPRNVFTLEGSLFVSDGVNGRVMVWTPIPGPGAIGPPARAVLGKPTLDTGLPGVSQRDMRSPFGVCGSGTSLFVVEVGEHRALRFTLTP